jgi:tRNA pseudouridine(55) synthase
MPVVVYKNVGETSFERLKRFREEEKIPESVKICYTGRLDPMACGQLELLIGDECKKMKEHMTHNKEYTVEAILGISTDSLDPLGLVTGFKEYTEEDVQSYIEKLMKLSGKTFSQKFPAFSGFMLRKKGERKALWVWKVEGDLDDSELPSKDITVYNIIVGEPTQIPLTEYIEEISKEIDLVDRSNLMRQDTVKDSWTKFDKVRYIYKIPITLIVSTGTYIRSVVSELDMHAHAHLITRTNIIPV